MLFPSCFVLQYNEGLCSHIDCSPLLRLQDIRGCAAMLIGSRFGNPEMARFVQPWATLNFCLISSGLRVAFLQTYPKWNPGQVKRQKQLLH